MCARLQRAFQTALSRPDVSRLATICARATAAQDHVWLPSVRALPRRRITSGYHLCARYREAITNIYPDG
jgi:hypothetical protein